MYFNFQSEYSPDEFPKGTSGFCCGKHPTHLIPSTPALRDTPDKILRWGKGYRVKPCCQKEIIKPDMFAAE